MELTRNAHIASFLWMERSCEAACMEVCVWRSWKMGWDKGKLKWPCGNLYTQTGTNAHSYTHTQYTHKGVNGMGCIGWGAPAAEAPGGVRRSWTLPTICKGESRHVQQVPPATIFMKLLTAAFGFHQAWQWEPQPPISLDPYLQCCRPFRNCRSPTPPINWTPVQACWGINKIPNLMRGTRLTVLSRAARRPWNLRMSEKTFREISCLFS